MGVRVQTLRPSEIVEQRLRGQTTDWRSRVVEIGLLLSLLISLGVLLVLLADIIIKSFPVSATIRSGDLAVDVARREATFNGESLTLTTKEFDLLAHLAGHPGRIFTRDQLLARLWGIDYEGDGRTVDVHVSWLRSKLRARDGHNYFRTVRGVGYAFAPRPARGA